ncbi:haloacid dehalogenase-like hydrolase [Pendulispora brunnea]|uniref:phosphoglycolate phosphatase n=1 Tax=Pendulispora brunnea TaxID=2905690 RepID=A0ABZ2K2C4_9BACT
MNSPTTLVLWDIDMTLIELPGLGRSWYERAWLKAIGSELRHHPTLSGRTERSITMELLASHGVEQTEEFIAQMFAALEAVVAEDSGTLAQRGRVFPGAGEALAALGALPNVVQSLVTGNLPSIAGHKLVPFGLHVHLDFEIGAYGSLSAHRPDLVGAAMRNATQKHGVPFAAESVVVIGDTPHDVAAALEHGALAVAVATGVFSEEELRAAGAHVTFPELSDTKAVLAAILRQT